MYFKLYMLCFNLYFNLCCKLFQFHVSIYVSIIYIGIKDIILFCNYRFVSSVGFAKCFTKSFTSVLEKIIIGLASWQLSIYTSLNFYRIEYSEAESKAKTKTQTYFSSYSSSWLQLYQNTFYKVSKC